MKRLIRWSYLVFDEVGLFPNIHVWPMTIEDTLMSYTVDLKNFPKVTSVSTKEVKILVDGNEKTIPIYLPNLIKRAPKLEVSVLVISSNYVEEMLILARRHIKASGIEWSTSLDVSRPTVVYFFKTKDEENPIPPEKPLVVKVFVILRISLTTKFTNHNLSVTLPLLAKRLGQLSLPTFSAGACNASKYLVKIVPCHNHLAHAK